MGESLTTVQKFDVPLEQATTSSLEALQAYSMGTKVYGEKGAEAALVYHERAIQLDPNFAMGYAAVAADHGSLADLVRANKYYTKAFKLRDHTSESEKLFITARYYLNVTGELDKAAQAYQEMIENYPRSLSGYFGLGIVYGFLGENQKAVEVMRQAQQLAPDLMQTSPISCSHCNAWARRAQQSVKPRSGSSVISYSMKRYMAWPFWGQILRQGRNNSSGLRTTRQRRTSAFLWTRTARHMQVI